MPLRAAAMHCMHASPVTPLQGTFKQAVAFEDALTGQEFPHEFQSLHGIGPLFKAARTLIQRLSPSAETRQVRPATFWHL